MQEGFRAEVLLDRGACPGGFAPDQNVRLGSDER